jgi:hypothetical protein
LLLVSARGGNVAVNGWLDDTVFATTALFVDHHDPGAPLPPHSLVLNAIGDADLSLDALRRAEHIVTACPTILNHPSAVLATGRIAIGRRFAGHPDIITPSMRRLPRDAVVQDPDLEPLFGFPLLLRSVGFHTGQHFDRVADRAELAASAATLPGRDLLAIAALDSRGADGRYRKYRVMVIDGRIYPLHLAISETWKVHYFSAAMANDPAAREEERRFLDDPAGTIGARAMRGLRHIQTELGLDYGGVDFGLAADGSLLLFEANATMVLIPPDPAPIWDYRRPAIDAAFAAARGMLARCAGLACGTPRFADPTFAEGGAAWHGRSNNASGLASP